MIGCRSGWLIDKFRQVLYLYCFFEASRLAALRGWQVGKGIGNRCLSWSASQSRFRFVGQLLFRLAASSSLRFGADQRSLNDPSTQDQRSSTIRLPMLEAWTRVFCFSRFALPGLRARVRAVLAGPGVRTAGAGHRPSDAVKNKAWASAAASLSAMSSATRPTILRTRSGSSCGCWSSTTSAAAGGAHRGTDERAAARGSWHGQSPAARLCRHRGHAPQAPPQRDTTCRTRAGSCASRLYLELLTCLTCLGIFEAVRDSHTELLLAEEWHA